MTLFEALVAITGILAVFGLSGLIILKIIQLIRDWVTSRRIPANFDELKHRFEQYEMKQEQLIKRIQNIETNLVENKPVREQMTGSVKEESDPTFSRQPSGRPLINKLRS